MRLIKQTKVGLFFLLQDRVYCIRKHPPPLKADPLAYLFREICGCFLRLEHERPVLPLIVVKGAVVTGLDLRQETETATRAHKKTGTFR